MTQHTVTQQFAPPVAPPCRIMARIGDAARADYAEQFPREMPEAQAFDCMDMLRAWYVERGFEFGDAVLQVAHLRGQCLYFACVGLARL